MFKRILKISLTASLILGTVNNTVAAEFVENEAVVYEDTGTNSINKIQEMPVPTYQAADAEEQAYNWLDNTPFNSGWNDDKKVYVSLGTAFFDSEDPSYDNSFITKRSLKTMEATLNAKAEIIEFIKTEMSATDKAVTPGTDLNAQFREEMDSLQAKMEGQKRKLAKLMADVDAKEASNLQGATFGDRMNSLMDASIKKLDEKYSTEQIEEAKKKKFELAKQRYQTALKEYEVVEKKIKATIGTVKETLSSKVETISSMPLFGALTMAQFESWDEDSEQYKVSLVVVWSAKNEKAARAFISGEEYKVKPQSKTIKEWIRQNDWTTSTGGRKFVDNRGVTYFIGIAASPVGKSSSSEKKARGVSELNAKKEVAMSLFADVASKKTAEQMMQTRNGGDGKDSSAAAESFSSTLSQSIENRQINGLQKFYGRKLTHPISNQKIFVTIYGISGEAAKAALLMEERNYISKILDIKNQQKLKGKTDGLREAVSDAKKDKSEYYKAKSTSKSNTVNSANEEYQKSNNTNSVINTQKSSKSNSPTSNGKPKSGTYSGGGNSQSYDW